MSLYDLLSSRMAMARRVQLACKWAVPDPSLPLNSLLETSEQAPFSHQNKQTAQFMMESSFKNVTQYTSEQFVESCGAILFDLSNSEEKCVCLIHYHKKNEWLLAKGRRNCGESRHKAALREVFEETGYQAHLHPVRMSTRAPPIDEKGHMPDEPRSYANLTEPFMVTTRQLSDDNTMDVKFIWWYIAALDHQSSVPRSGSGEEEFTPAFFPLEQALEKLSFTNDRMILRRAIELIEAQ